MLQDNEHDKVDFICYFNPEEKDKINSARIQGKAAITFAEEVVDLDIIVYFSTDKIKIKQMQDETMENLLAYQAGIWQLNNPNVFRFVLCSLDGNNYFLMPYEHEESDNFKFNQYGLMETKENIDVITLGIGIGILSYNLYGWYVHSRHGDKSMPLFNLYNSFLDKAINYLKDEKQRSIIYWMID